MSHFQPWQSWSPAKRNIFGLPTWDYCPLPLANKKTNFLKQKSTKEPISYWCSWYAFGEKISEKIILEQASLLNKSKLKIDYILIDDGWTKWGDWHKVDEEKFPSGIGALSKKLAQKNFKTGLWLAPFLADKKSRLFKEHPEYFLRSKSGKLVNGFKSFPFFDSLLHPRFLLDFNKKEVKQFVFESLDQMMRKWNISLLKLDFLYAPYFNPHLKNADEATKQVQELLIYLKTQHPQVFTIACGCSFSDAANLADAIRISKDISAPPPMPKIFRKIFYEHRAQVLFAKLKHKSMWKGCLADPDVRIFDLENKKSEAIFEKLSESKDFLQGFGDQLKK